MKRPSGEMADARNDPDRAGRINELYQFGHNEFIALTAKYDIFSVELTKNLYAQAAEKDHVNQALWSQLHTQNLQVVEITSSMAWSLILRFRRFRLWLIPSGGMREKLLKIIFQSLRIWRKDGFCSVYQKVI